MKCLGKPAKSCWTEPALHLAFVPMRVRFTCSTKHLQSPRPKNFIAKLPAICALWLLFAVPVHAQIKFDGEDYTLGWQASTNGSVVKEFFRNKETTNTWKAMLTFQSHPAAKKVKDVSAPYFEARKSIMALPPKIHPKTKGDPSDAVVELFLGAPGKTPHLEFVLARFLETDSGVYAVIHSRKYPMSKRKNQNLDVTDAVKNKEKWIQELLAIPVESIKQRF